MKNIVSNFLALLFLFLSQVVNSQKVSWVYTNPQARWIKKTDLDLSKAGAVVDSIVEIDIAKKYQKIEGFGGCFNEMGWTALSVLTAGQKQDIFKELFDTTSGCKFNICRLPIGANDFAHQWYSLNDSVNDFDMKYFNLKRDEQILIPYIKSALQYNPKLKFWGSPWSPPAWLKENNHFACVGWNKWECCADFTKAAKLNFANPKYQQAYSNYFVKYVQEYRKKGINIYAIHVQNEPFACQIFPSCVWKGEEMRDFVRDYLGPKFKQEKLNAEIWLGTINNGVYKDYAGVVLADTAASKYISGVGYQWDGKKAIEQTYSEHPEKNLMQTESECGNGLNEWKYAEYIFGLMKFYFDNGARSYMYWNMVLDEHGFSNWMWRQNSLVTVSGLHKSVTYNPEFYVMRHFSYFVKPGAVRVHTGGNSKWTVSFLNPDNELIIASYNKTDKEKEVTYKLGKKTFTAVQAPHSFNTYSVKNMK